jgi:hypothetical protein
VILAVVDRAADVATGVATRQVLYRKAKLDAIRLRQMLLECLVGLPHIDDEGVVGGNLPIDDAQLLLAGVRAGGGAKRE